jgi:hypothetical protein
MNDTTSTATDDTATATPVAFESVTVEVQPARPAVTRTVNHGAVTVSVTVEADGVTPTAEQIVDAINGRLNGYGLSVITGTYDSATREYAGDVRVTGVQLA